MQFEDPKQCDYYIFNKIGFYFCEIKVTKNNKEAQKINGLQNFVYK